MKVFTGRLKALRKEAGVSQGVLASHLGVSKSSVNMYERGEREPSFETMEAIADHFNVDLDYLYGRSNVRNRAQEEFGQSLSESDAPCEKNDTSPIDVVDPELRSYLDELRERPDKKLLFSVTKGATKEEIMAIVRMYEELKREK